MLFRLDAKLHFRVFLDKTPISCYDEYTKQSCILGEAKMTLAEYKAAYEQLHKRMVRVKNLASALKDGRFWFGATSFRLDVEQYIKTMESTYTVYTTAPSYAKKDFTDYVRRLETQVTQKEEKLAKVKAVSDCQ